jgi:hypothetical protein
MKKLPHVNFMPFVGRSYGYHSAFAIPVLVLGESHYTATSRKSFPSSFTRDVMDDVISGEEWKFFTRVSETFRGERSVDPRTFWNSVAFYNFIQTVIKKNTRPTAQMWRDAERPFLEVLEALRPRLVAIFGFQTWENTPCHGRNAKPITHLGHEVPCYEFGCGDSWSLAPKLRHPSRGFSPKQWHAVILKSLARAGGHEFRL